MKLVFLAVSLLASTAAWAEAPRVATDIVPVHGLVSRVMQGVGAPDLIVPVGASPHGHAMRPSEARALSEAEVVIWIGPALSPGLGQPIETLAGNAAHVVLMDLPGMTLLEARQDARFGPHEHDHGEKHGHDAHEHSEDEQHNDTEGENHAGSHDHDEHDHGSIDGHLWLDPGNAALILDAVAETLAKVDSANAQTYRDNAADGKSEIAAVANTLRVRLQPMSGRSFVVFHDSYQYFERSFGLNAAASISLGDESGASAARLSEVRDIVVDTGASCVLAELRANEGLIAAVAQETNVVTLDALGVDIGLGPQFYTELLQQIGDGLAACLSEG